MPELPSLALAASMTSPLRPGDWFLAVTTMGASAVTQGAVS